MLYLNETKIIAKVWDVKPAQNGKYIDLRISTSEKDQHGERVYSTWFPRVIGHAVNSLRNIEKGDFITITRAKLSNEQYTDKDGRTRSSFRFIIYEAEKSAERSNQPTMKKEEAPKAAKDDDIPW